MTETEQIIAAYNKTSTALLANPDSAEDLAARLALLTARGERSPAHLALAERCAANAPNEFIAIFNLASAKMRACMPSSHVFKRALDLAETDEQKALTKHHLGLAHHELGEFQAALNWYASAGPCAAQSAAITKLASGDLAAGLYEFEVQHHKPPRKPITESGIPRWTGQTLRGKTLILSHEQGFGDTLQFIRFVPQLRALDPRKLILSGPPSLTGLLEKQFKFDAVIDEEGPFKGDYVTSPLSAAGVMGIRYQDVTGQPYMTAQPMDLPSRGKLKVGLSWKGSPTYARDADRSASLRDLCPLLDVPGVAFYSLQVRPGPEEVHSLGLDGFVADLGGLLNTWEDTASAISAMDLVISTDSANGHLAGALGKPVWLLLNEMPCWRWMLNRRDSPWYRGHKLFRQKEAGAWPINAVRDALVMRAHG